MYVPTQLTMDMHGGNDIIDQSIQHASAQEIAHGHSLVKLGCGMIATFLAL